VDEARIIEMAQKQRRKIPASILNKPQLRDGLQMFYRAFMELSSCRQIGMAEGPIPWTAIQLWCNEGCLLGTQRDSVFYHVRRMDLAYMKHQSGKIKTK